MKIIVCGAGATAQSVVSYLIKGANDIIVVDDSQRQLDEMAKEYDILPVYGTPSHPDVLEKAGAKNADIILALTPSDETNMIICQLAYSLFDVRKKIAAVNSKTFMDPLWGMLYNDNHLPIDLLISPDIDIAEYILQILHYPGSAGVLPVLDGKYSILTLDLGENIPFGDMQLGQIIKQVEAISGGFINIVRQNISFLPDMYENLNPFDQINLLVKTDDIFSVISAFGLEKPSNERLVIFGGSAIAQYICSQVEKDDSITSTSLIEEDIDHARLLARQLNKVVVINGDMMSDVILEEADISKADAAISLTDNDKDNLLASMIASHNGVGTNIAVINTPSYNNLMFNISQNTLVDRSAITMSHLLKEIRHSRIENAYSIARSQGEIWDIALTEENACVDKKNGELGLPKSCRIIAILRSGSLIYPDLNTKLEAKDRVLIYVASDKIKQAEEVFC